MSYSNISIYVTINITGQTQSNVNVIPIVPDSPNTDYILIEFTEKQNCNNVITALFSNTTTNCDNSEINIISADTSDLVNGQINWTKLGRYTAKVYYQSSSTNLDTSLATYSYETCVDVESNDNCTPSDFSCEALEDCSNFNAKLDTVSVDGITISGDGTPSNPLQANTGGSGDMTKAVYDPQNIASDAFSQDNMTDGVTNKNYTATEQTKLLGIETGAEVNQVNEAPIDSNTYAREGGAWVAFTKFLSNAVNTVTGVFSLRNGDYSLILQNNNAQFGKNYGANTGYFEALFTGGLQRMKFWSSDSITPETGDDYSQTLTPTNYGKNFVPVGYVQPTSLTISTATATLNSTNIVNQSIYYNGSGGNITIDATYLNIEQEAAITRLGSNDFTLVASGGAVLLSEDNFTATTKQYQTIGIKKISSTEYLLVGATS